MNIDINSLLKNPVAIIIALLIVAAIFAEIGLGFIAGALTIGAVVYAVAEGIKAASKMD